MASGSGTLGKRTVTAAMEKYIYESDDVKVEIKALELLMDPEDSEVV